jgi:hypothetical protein
MKFKEIIKDYKFETFKGAGIIDVRLKNGKRVIDHLTISSFDEEPKARKILAKRNNLTYDYTNNKLE